LEKDPAYFEAYFNTALIALQVADWRAALHASETALVINPTNAPARVNLAQALEHAGYPVDAANEWNKVIEVKPDDVRAHLALANLQAQKLGQAGQARTHYLKVLELDPRHPRATEIRYWLAANP
jgi:tetratricopeptide (TPR) repeat protein